MGSILRRQRLPYELSAYSCLAKKLSPQESFSTAIRICCTPGNRKCVMVLIMDSRAIAARILDMVLRENIHLDSAYSELIPAAIKSREQAFVNDCSDSAERAPRRLEPFGWNSRAGPIRRKDTD